MESCKKEMEEIKCDFSKFLTIHSKISPISKKNPHRYAESQDIPNKQTPKAPFRTPISLCIHSQSPILNPIYSTTILLGSFLAAFGTTTSKTPFFRLAFTPSWST